MKLAVPLGSFFVAAGSCCCCCGPWFSSSDTTAYDDGSSQEVAEFFKAMEQILIEVNRELEKGDGDGVPDPEGGLGADKDTGTRAAARTEGDLAIPATPPGTVPAAGSALDAFRLPPDAQIQTRASTGPTDASISVLVPGGNPRELVDMAISQGESAGFRVTVPLHMPNTSSAILQRDGVQVVVSATMAGNDAFYMLVATPL